MSLTNKDLENIKDIVEFAIDQSEQRTDAKFDKIDARFDSIDTKLKKMDRDIEDIIETQGEFLNILGRHDTEIKKLQIKTGLKAI
jgi:archaellum component FlaC